MVFDAAILNAGMFTEFANKFPTHLRPDFRACLPGTTPGILWHSASLRLAPQRSCPSQSRSCGGSPSQCWANPPEHQNGANINLSFGLRERTMPPGGVVLSPQARDAGAQV